jgi:hypothetical protein
VNTTSPISLGRIRRIFIERQQPSASSHQLLSTPAASCFSKADS